MILVTGTTSGLGRNAIDFLLETHIPCRATGRNLQQGAAISALGIEFIPADLANLNDEQAQQLFANVNTVWHCAALSSPWGEYQQFYAANVTATEKLLHYAAEYGVKNFIHISTPSIYFDYKTHFFIDEHYQAKKPVNDYALTKLMAEQSIKANAIKHPDIFYTMLRPRAIFGEHDRVLLPRLIALIKQRKGKLVLPRKGEAILDMTYVLNVVEAMYLATMLPDKQKKKISGKAYNITNQEPAKLNIVLSKLLHEEINMPFKIKSLPYPLLDLVARLLTFFGNYRNKEPIITRYSIGALNYDMTLSNTQAQQDLGYFPKYSLQEGIQRTAKWFNNNGKDH